MRKLTIKFGTENFTGDIPNEVQLNSKSLSIKKKNHTFTDNSILIGLK